MNERSTFTYIRSQNPRGLTQLATTLIFIIQEYIFKDE